MHGAVLRTQMSAQNCAKPALLSEGLHSAVNLLCSCLSDAKAAAAQTCCMKGRHMLAGQLPQALHLSAHAWQQCRHLHSKAEHSRIHNSFDSWKKARGSEATGPTGKLEQAQA